GIGGGTAVALDGVDDCGSVPHHADFNMLASTFTLEMWVQLDNAAADKLQILADKTSVTIANFQWYLGYDNRSSQSSPQRLRFLVAGRTGTSVTVDWLGAGADLAAGGHLVARRDGNDLTLWWDGVQVASATSSQ